MNALRHIAIGPRLAAGFALVVLLLMAVAGIGLTQIHAVNRGLDALVSDRYQKVGLVNAIQKDFLQQGVRIRNIVVLEDDKDIAAEISEMDATITRISANMDKLQAAIYTPEGKAMLAESAVARAKFLDARKLLVKLVLDKDLPEARNHLARVVRPAHAAYYDALERLNQRQIVRMDEAVAEAQALVDRATWAILALAGVAAVVAAGIALAITRSITRPLAQAVAAAEAVAAGDLGTRLAADGRDEPGRLLATLGRMTGSLAGLVGQVRQASGNIATGASQIATGNEDLSQRTEQQASNLQETAASMEQITSTVKANADIAREASDLAAAASGAARDGGTAVGQVVATMQTITESSHRIGEITSVIDGIAFQTNILALNAAVEAARAGEQGRGFAVVAGEVRSLAQRAASAAKEIKDLITDSAGKVETGSRQAAEAGRTMDDIVARVERVSGLIGQISNATGEQSRGISQVGDAINQLDQVTQQNAALVEESAAAAESLNQQAAQLVQAVSVFRLAQGEAGMALAQAKATSQARVQASAAKPATPAPAPVSAPVRAAAPAPAAPAPAPHVAPHAAPEPVVSPLSGKPSPAAADGWDSF